MHARTTAALARAGRRQAWPFGLLLALAFGAPAAAQMRSYLITNGTVLVGDGTRIESGDVQFSGGEISAVGKELKGQLLTKKINAKGKFVTPGLIDVWSSVALRSGGGDAKATGRAIDAFDRFADDELNAALHSGVTTAFIPARSGRALGGFGSVVRLTPGASRADVLLKEEAGYCSALGDNAGEGPIGRAKALRELSKQFQAAKDYRQALEDYDEELKEYEKKLKEFLEKEAGKDGKREGESKPADGEKKEERKDDRKKDAGRKGEAPPSDGGRAEDKKDEKKPEGPKKPEAPAKDRVSEALLKLIEGEQLWRVEAARPADIQNALDIAKAFNLALVFDGARGAHTLAKLIADREIPVVLAAPDAGLLYTGGPERYEDPHAVAILKDAGVRVFLASGAAASRHLPLLAAQAVGQGFTPDEALQRLTADAASLLGVDKQVGKLAKGLSADIVIWSDHPFAPGARVERVFVAGREVYRASDQKDE